MIFGVDRPVRQYFPLIWVNSTIHLSGIKKIILWGLVTYVFNSSAGEVEAGGSGDQDHFSLYIIFEAS